MPGRYYSSTAEDPFFIEIKRMLTPLITETETGNVQAAKKATRLLFEMIRQIPATHFKDSVYTKQLFKAMKLYLESGDISHVSIIARLQKTDRLELIRTIACDTLEYLAFLPIKLQEDSTVIRRYVVHMDNAIWLLRRIKPDNDWLKTLQRKMQCQ